MQWLSTGIQLGYHGCDRVVGERILAGEAFRPSENDFDWLGPGIYFWEANPLRALDFAKEAMRRRGSRIRDPFVIGAAIDPGNCFDLTTTFAITALQSVYASLEDSHRASGQPLPRNSPDQLRRFLDCAVIRRLHAVMEERRLPRIDSVRGVFTEGGPAYEGSGFAVKTHIQVAICNPDCIKGIFRVPAQHLAPFS